VTLKDGTFRWFMTNLSYLREADGDDSRYHFVGIFYDVDNRKQAEIELKSAHFKLETKVQERTAALNKANECLKEEIAKREVIQRKIRHLAYHDHLTDLPNRLLFTELLNHGMSLSRRTGHMIAVLFLDLDGFKMINDTLGHHAGDHMLQAVSQRLAGELREADTIARIGGDEVVIMLENNQVSEAAKVIAERLLRSFDHPFLLEEQECYLTTSIGIAQYPTDGEDAETLIKNADIAMYKAKEKGKNQFVFCTPLMKMNVQQNMRLSNHLYRAIEKGELELYYQPQVNSGTSEIIGLEALLRWHHPDDGMLSPTVFIPIAEQTGQIVPIGEWVMRTACRQNKVWQEMGLPKLRMAVNVSVRQLQSAGLIRKVKEIFVETGMGPEHLEIEITESAIMNEHNAVIDTLAALKEMGIKIAIDDFGTEYSSLNYIKRLPIDRIKIAMPFIHGIDVSQKDEAIVKAVIVLAKSLDFEVIAEGVETNYQLDFLSQRMCDEVQGFFFYKPMPAYQVEQLLREMTLSATA
jgi:diguanylate cyclase (GGDEF)-like protein